MKKRRDSEPYIVASYKTIHRKNCTPELHTEN